MDTHYISRVEVKAILDLINSSPWRLFTAKVVRRSTVHLRYPPRNMTDNGALARVGDHFPINAEVGNPNVTYGPDGKRYDLLDTRVNRRKGDKIVLQEAGEVRWITVKNYNREKGNGCRHAPELTGAGRHYDPLAYDLYPLAGFYNDDLKVQPDGKTMTGRFGQWRPYTQVCMRGIIEFKALGHKWIVTDPPTDQPIRYASERELTYSRKHVVTDSGMSNNGGRGLIASSEAWEVEMGLAQ